MVAAAVTEHLQRIAESTTTEVDVCWPLAHTPHHSYESQSKQSTRPTTITRKCKNTFHFGALQPSGEGEKDAQELIILVYEPGIDKVDIVVDMNKQWIVGLATSICFKRQSKVAGNNQSINNFIHQFSSRPPHR